MASLYKRKGRKGKDDKWIIRWKDAETDTWRDKTGYADKEASREMARRLERQSARRAEGLIDPLDEQRRRPIGEHVTDFIAKVTAGNRAPGYVTQLRGRIDRIIGGVGAKRLLELDPVKVGRFITDLRKAKADDPVSSITKNEYTASIKALTKWAVEARRIAVDPLAALRRIEGKAIDPVHPRRALSPVEVGRLLDAATRRPLLELKTVRRGPHRGNLTAKVSLRAAAKAQREGAERSLVYLIAVWSGLRRSEIKALVWGDLDLEGAVPRMTLRAKTTKAKRGDNLVIHPQLAEALRAHRPVEFDPRGRVVRFIPNMRTMRADLQMAGIDYGDQEIGFVDFHSMRKSMGTMMAVAGMSPRTRQAHMRHRDPRLTENTYMDERLLPIASELNALPPVPSPNDPAPESIPLSATGTNGM